METKTSHVSFENSRRLAVEAVIVLAALDKVSEPALEGAVYLGLFEAGLNEHEAASVVDAIHSLGYVGRPRPALVEITDLGREHVRQLVSGSFVVPLQ